ncbi:hypothetical protein KQI74_17820 [Paenibacillus barcinonensis]|jgi:hypothetical protein|uniref:hypothetical protein n=1 Tax=Paenibacillus TaxID=44249 RepID=UPI001C100F7F|nr:MULTISPECIES: hypothetical protein [Paenibacillus]MBU5354150.1 hypothetical protein [Paenibacillus barcinonensis]MDM5276410.1 hypothetical protein [Paenibacillus silvae]
MKIPDPTWARLGFLEPPNFDTSGQDVGIIIIDRLKPHPALRHLGHRLKYITVQPDLSVHCNEEVAYQAYADSFLEGQDEGARLKAGVDWILGSNTYSGCCRIFIFRISWVK